jgi:hypothetical protein
MSKILETTRFVVEQSASVNIDQGKVLEFADNFDHGDVQHWLSASPLDFKRLSDNEKLNFVLVFNSLSFSYWGDPKWTIAYQDRQADGAWGMILALKRALDEGKPVLDSEFRAKMTKADLANLLRGNVEIPLLQERHEIIQATGKILIEKYHGDFAEAVKKSNQDINVLLDSIVTNFPSFRDETTYKGRQVFFYKRAQLLISDIHQLFSKRGYGEFNNADQITACADYKLPQALRKFGVLVYSKTLADKIDQRFPIAHASEEEIEIRANTIWAIEYIRQRVQKRMPKVTSMDINDHLWLYTQTKYPDDRPYHLTRTTCY